MKYIILLLIFLPAVVIADPYTIEIKIRAFSLKEQIGTATVYWFLLLIATYSEF